jgi:CRISPR/Cas system CMR-associated protein Cmr5 small subunit
LVKKKADTVEKKLASVAAVAELPPLVTKNGTRHPGLVAHLKGGAQKFHSPLIVNRTRPHEASQQKRRSDISHDLLRAKNIEDEDSFMVNQDLEALFRQAKNNNSIDSSSGSSDSSISNPTLLSAKRVKKE